MADGVGVVKVKAGNLDARYNNFDESGWRQRQILMQQKGVFEGMDALRNRFVWLERSLIKGSLLYLHRRKEVSSGYCCYYVW